MWLDPGRQSYLASRQKMYLLDTVSTIALQMDSEGYDYSSFDKVLSWVEQRKSGRGIHPSRLAAMVRHFVREAKANHR